MAEQTSSDLLKQTYLNTKYKLMGHGVSSTNDLIEAMEAIGKDVERDYYGTGEVIENFQNKLAKECGFEAGVFFPSGTMAQQIALRMWCDISEVKTVAYHPLCHLEIHEEDGLKELHGIRTVLLGEEDRLFTLEDLKAVPEILGAVVIELPQREIGGQLPSFEELEAISDYCHEAIIPLHLDGARLFECLPYYGKTASEICALFDSVYISFYKGIGGVTGAMLLGDEDFCDESKVWKRRHGGDLYALYPYIIPADYYYEQRKDKFTSYYKGAVKLAKLFNECKNITINPEVPVSNMFHVHIDLPKEAVEKALTEAYKTSEVGIRANIYEDEKSCYFEFNVGDCFGQVPEEKIELCFKKLKELL